MNPAEFVERFLRLRELTEPDGRRLFEYECSNPEFRELTIALCAHGEPAHLWQQLGFVGNAVGDQPDFDDEDRRTMAAFVLYGAEWFKRHPAPPRRTWARMLLPLLWQPTNYPGMYLAIVQGLNWWRTTAIRTPTKTLYFDTLAYQGGLAMEGMLVMEFIRVEESHEEASYAPVNAPAGFVAQGIRLEKRRQRRPPTRIIATFDLGWD